MADKLTQALVVHELSRYFLRHRSPRLVFLCYSTYYEYWRHELSSWTNAFQGNLYFLATAVECEGIEGETSHSLLACPMAKLSADWRQPLPTYFWGPSQTNYYLLDDVHLFALHVGNALDQMIKTILKRKSQN